MHAMSEFARSLDGKGASNTLRRHLVILDDQVTFLVHSMPDQPTLGSVDLDNLFDLVSVRIELAQVIPVSGWAADAGIGQVCHWSVIRALAAAPFPSGDHPSAIGCYRLGIVFSCG